MYRQAVVTAALGATLILGGCATNAGGQPTLGGISAADVKADVLLVCSFVPEAATVANVIAAAISSGVPGLNTAMGIAQGLCASLATVAPTATLRRAVSRRQIQPTFLNVPIYGNFVR
jgi:hypothetical protein